MARQEEGEGEVAPVGSRACGGGTTARGKSATVVGEGATWGGGLPGRERKGLHVWEKMEKLHGQRWREAHRRRGPSLEPRRIPSIGAKRRSDRRIESTGTKLSTRRTQHYSRILPTTHRLKVIAHWSWDHPRTLLELSSD
jgi:hypothetical protein